MSNKLSIQQLESMGGLVSEEPVLVDIDWYAIDDDGKRVPASYAINVLRLPFKAIEDVTRDSKSVTIGLISAGIVFDGGVRLTQDQAGRLAPDLVSRLIQAFNKVNGTGGQQGNV